MSYHISSRRFNNPGLHGLLKILAEFFQTIQKEFYIIGATARDIVLGGIYAQHPGRRTNDVDIAIAISDWAAFREIADGICSIPGFRASNSQKQRFYYKEEMTLDIVPFGEIATSDKTIFWPPEATPAMSVAGFTEMARSALSVRVDDQYTILVASLPGILILKMIAWQDRHIETSKDAEDMVVLLDQYLEINFARAAETFSEIFTTGDFTTFTAGATLMGKDIRKLLSDDEELRLQCLKILKNEVEKEEYSPLINQMLETHRLRKYEDIYQALVMIINELST